MDVVRLAVHPPGSVISQMKCLVLPKGIARIETPGTAAAEKGLVECLRGFDPKARRGGRVAECGGLLNRCTG